jgi:hypothetical protein
LAQYFPLASRMSGEAWGGDPRAVWAVDFHFDDYFSVDIYLGHLSSLTSPVSG